MIFLFWVGGVVIGLILLCDKSDIDECAEGIDTCNPIRGICTNLIGSYACNCTDGFLGDGRICNPPTPCAVSEWETSTFCSSSCGFGSRMESRHVLRAPSSGGMACPSLTRTWPCYLEPCSGRQGLQVIMRSSSSGSNDLNQIMSDAVNDIGPTATFQRTATGTDNGQGDVVVEFLVDVAASSSAVAAASLDNLTPSGVVDVAVTFVDECYCNAAELGGLLWLGATCGDLSPSIHFCPGRTDLIITRNCTGYGIDQGWDAIDASVCEHPVLTEASANKELLTTSDLLSTALNVTGNSRLFGVADTSNIESILDEILLRQTDSSSLSIDETVAFIRLLARLIDADEETVKSGMSTFGRLTGASIIPRVESMLLQFATERLPENNTLSIVEGNIAVDIYNTAFNPSGIVLQPSDVKVAESRRCYGAPPKQYCFVLDFGENPTTFDEDMSITIPNSVITLSMSYMPNHDFWMLNNNGISTINASVSINDTKSSNFHGIIGGISPKYLFPSVNLRNSMSQVVFAAVANLPEEYNISHDPLIFSATPRFYNGTDTGCAIWNPGSWDTNFCELLNPEVDSGAYECACNHLSLYGLVEMRQPLPSFQPPEYDDYLRGAVALACLFLVSTSILFLLQPAKWSPSRMVVVHQGLFLSALLIIFAAAFYDIRKPECRRIGVVQHVFAIGFVGWTFAGAILSVARKARAWQVALIGYIAPIVVVTVTAVLHYDDYGRRRSRTDPDKHCFIDADKDIIWAIYGPVAGLSGLASLIHLYILSFSMCCWPKEQLRVWAGRFVRHGTSTRKVGPFSDLELDDLGSRRASISGKRTKQSNDQNLHDQPVTQGYAVWMSLSNVLLSLLSGHVILSLIFVINGILPDFWRPLFAAGIIFYVSLSLCVYE